MTSPALGTVVSARKLPLARRLALTCSQHVPASRLTVLVVDAAPAGDLMAPDVDVVTPADLGLDPLEFARMATLYTEAELVAALKPSLLSHLLDAGADVAVSFAPEVEVLGPIDALVEAAASGVALVARGRSALPLDDLQPTDIDALREGLFDAGSLAVSRHGREFLGWWRDKLRRECLDEPQNQHFLDQRWLDLVPGRFGYRMVDDPGAGVAPWNLGDSRVTKSDDGYFVDGAPVRWFHFAGFDPQQPELLAPSLHAPRVALSTQPDLAALCRERAEWLRNAASPADPGYGFDRLPDGSAIDLRMRHLYRGALQDAEARGSERPPTPFGPDGADRFVAWLNQPVAPKIDPVVSRYLARLWGETQSLHATYPDLSGETAVAFLGAVRTFFGASIPTAVRPTDDQIGRLRQNVRQARPTAPPAPGVNLVGYLDAVLGIGEAARLVGSALAHGGVPHRAITYAGSRSERGATYDAGRSSAEHDLNIICVNPDLFVGVAHELGPEFFAGRHTIGFWFWEVDKFPPGLDDAFELVDEIWVASAYIRDMLAPISPKPVRHVPLPVPLPPDRPEVHRSDLDVPEDRFLFLFAYDFLSTARRKNPLGVIDAYRRAFGPDDGACLLLKSINGSQERRELERVLMAAGDRDDIVVMDRYLPVDHHFALTALCDAYVSLHRAEGFGLTMAEAMAHQKPVIATRFSGNLDFMDDDNAFLVDAAMTEVGAGVDIYPADAQWAEPDLDHAARLMREVFERREEAAARGARAAARIRGDYSLEAVAPRLSALVEEARGRHGQASATWRNFFMAGWRLAHNPAVRRFYEYDWLPDGTPVDDTAQGAFEVWQHAARLGRASAPPNPDVPGGAEGTLAWLNEPVAPPERPVVSRYLLQLWRDDVGLQERFPRLDAGFDAWLFGPYFDAGEDEADETPGDPGPYLDWVREHWHDQTDIPYRLVPTAERADPAPEGEPAVPTTGARVRRAIRRLSG